MLDRYFEWLTEIVCNSRRRALYNYLLRYLFGHEFFYTIPMDENRATDGMELRYRFGKEMGIPKDIIEEELDNRNCSILEMLVALSLRIEETIMDDPDVGDRTSDWFWMMIKNLDLIGETDDIYDEDRVEFIITRFLERLYDSDGKGGLVRIEHPRSDLRYVDIWYQLMWYLSDNYL